MNKIRVVGNIISDITYSHTTKVKNEDMYSFKIETHRMSETSDICECIIPQILMGNFSKGDCVEVVGTVRTRNDGRLHVYIFVDSIISSTEPHNNNVELDGYICMLPTLRETTHRQVCDLMLSVKRNHATRTSYIPCIVWGRDALRISEMKLGTHIHVTGRLQSRQYSKVVDEETITRTIHELSVQSFKEVDDDEEILL